MPTCSFRTCKNTTRKRNPTEKISFFPFPKDEQLRKLWIIRCGRTQCPNLNPEVARVCSLHFHKDDFERDLRHELLNLPLRQMLKKDAIPSGNPSNKIDEEQKFREEYIKSLLGEEENESKNIKIEPESDSEQDFKQPVEFQIGPAIKYEVDLKVEPDFNLEENPRQPEFVTCEITPEIAEKKEDFLNINNEDLLKEYISLKEKVALKKEQLTKTKAQIRSHQQKIKSLSIAHEKFQSKIDEKTKALQKILSSAQIDALLQIKKTITWSEKDRIKAANLKKMNEQSFSFIRENLNFPLPNVTFVKYVQSKVSEKQSSRNVPSCSKEA